MSLKLVKALKVTEEEHADAFERFANAFLVDDYPDLKALGGKKDKGMDAYVYNGEAGKYAVGGYPFEPDVANSHQWRDVIDPWLAGIGSRVYDQAPYRLGLIGFDISGEMQADDIAASGVPSHHYPGILWPAAGAVAYHPSTE